MNSFNSKMASLGVCNLGLVLLQPFSNGCRVIVLLRNGHCITFYSKSRSSNPDLGCCVLFLSKLLMVVWYEQRRTTHWTNQKSKQSTQALSSAENVRHYVSRMRVESTRLKNVLTSLQMIHESGDWLVGGDLEALERIKWNDGQTTKCRRRICFPTP